MGCRSVLHKLTCTDNIQIAADLPRPARINTNRVHHADRYGAAEARNQSPVPVAVLLCYAGDFSGGLSLSPVGSRNHGIMSYAAVIATRDCLGA